MHEEPTIIKIANTFGIITGLSRSVNAVSSAKIREDMHAVPNNYNAVNPLIPVSPNSVWCHVQNHYRISNVKSIKISHTKNLRMYLHQNISPHCRSISSDLILDIADPLMIYSYSKIFDKIQYK